VYNKDDDTPTIVIRDY